MAEALSLSPIEQHNRQNEPFCALEMTSQQPNSPQMDPLGQWPATHKPQGEEMSADMSRQYPTRSRLPRSLFALMRRFAHNRHEPKSSLPPTPDPLTCLPA